MTGFLSCWVYEELWHGEAFSDFLRAYGLEVPAEPKLPDGSTPMPTRPNRVARFREQMGVGHKLFLLPTMLASLVMRDFVALHMTWGAINELTTLTGYHQLMRRSSHPVLHEMLRRIIQDERRHFAFYRAQAKARMEGNPRAGKIVRMGLNAFWTPVGAGVKSQEEVDALAIYLFGDSPAGREGAREVDSTIAELPGLEGLTLLEDALDAALARAAASPGYAGRRCTARRCPASGPPRWPRRWPRAPPGLGGAELAQLVAGADGAAAHDVGTQAAAVDEALQHARLRQLLEVAARVAQPPPDALDLTDGEAAAHEVVQRDAAREDVAACLGRRQLDAGVACEPVDRLRLDERDVAAVAARVVGERAAVVEVAIALETLPRLGARRLHRRGQLLRCRRRCRCLDRSALHRCTG